MPHQFYIQFRIVLCLVMVSGISHTCQPIQFTSIKYSFSLFGGEYGHIGKWIQENIIFMRFCCCFKLSKKTEKLLNEQLTLTNHQMHNDWPNTIG